MSYAENQEEEYGDDPDSFSYSLPPISAPNGIIEFISSDGTVPQGQSSDLITSDSITFTMPNEETNQYAQSMTIVVSSGPASDVQECQRHIRRCQTNLTQNVADWGNYFNCLREAGQSSDCGSD